METLLLSIKKNWKTWQIKLQTLPNEGGKIIFLNNAAGNNKGPYIFSER